MLKLFFKIPRRTQSFNRWKSGNSEWVPSSLFLLRSVLCSVKWIFTLFYRHICTYVFFSRQRFAICSFFSNCTLLQPSKVCTSRPCRSAEENICHSFLTRFQTRWSPELHLHSAWIWARSSRMCRLFAKVCVLLFLFCFYPNVANITLPCFSSSNVETLEADRRCELCTPP